MVSKRQQQILSLISLGATNREIAAHLGISAETVKTHVKIILRAFEARSRAHAVAIAFREGDLE